MRFIVDLYYATIAFLRALLKNRSRVVGVSSNGHTILKGWERAPEEQVLERYNQRTNEDRLNARLALVGQCGSQKGRIWMFNEGRVTLSSNSDANCVLTPVTAGEDVSFQLLINGSIELIAEPNKYFRLNGVQSQRAVLIDYDELELMGNTLLVLTVESSIPKSDQGEA